MGERHIIYLLVVFNFSVQEVLSRVCVLWLGKNEFLSHWLTAQWVEHTIYIVFHQVWIRLTTRATFSPHTEHAVGQGPVELKVTGSVLAPLHPRNKRPGTYPRKSTWRCVQADPCALLGWHVHLKEFEDPVQRLLGREISTVP